jgi:hypothetical protein
MGTQQLLLIILGIIIVGIAIVVGITLSTGMSITSNRDYIIADLEDLAANAYQYRIRPSTIGGGGGTYVGFTIPTTLQSNENAMYTVNSATGAQISLTGTSILWTGTVTGMFGTDGKISGTFTFTGQFQ